MIETRLDEVRENIIKDIVDTAKKKSREGNFPEATDLLSSARNEYELLICKEDDSNNFLEFRDYIIEGHKYNKINRSIKNESC